MVGLVEASAAKTMVRSLKGMNRAFVVETAGDGASGLAVQVEGSCFETIWGLNEGGPGGVFWLNKVGARVEHLPGSRASPRLLG